MAEAQNILVGVDLSHGDRFVSDEVPEANRAAVNQAIELAACNGAKLTFSSVIDLPLTTLDYLIEEDPGAAKNLEAKADRVLQSLVKEAESRGVKSVSTLHALGRSWIELTKQVLVGNFDLLIVGSRVHSNIDQWLMGTTGRKLIHSCPCPVWVTKAKSPAKPHRILVADDLTPVGARLVRLGAELARVENSELHILHSFEYPWDANRQRSDARQEAFRLKALSHAQQILGDHTACPEVASLANAPKIHLREELAETAILAAIEKEQIDLLIMATSARTGLLGYLLGNTAERLVSQIGCALLTVKPEGFHCPITLETT